MKVLVLWENSAEKPLAMNLVKVLRKIGAMLIYGTVNETGVLLENWQGKPKVGIDCLATAMPEVDLGTDMAVKRTYTRPESAFIDDRRYAYEMEYVDGQGYTAPAFQPVDVAAGTLSITRELMRDLVRMFPGEGDKEKAEAAALKQTKPVVPKPKTTKTGVTVRKLDLWEDDDHADSID